jgi:hypothetical protein
LASQSLIATVVFVEASGPTDAAAKTRNMATTANDKAGLVLFRINVVFMMIASKVFEISERLNHNQFPDDLHFTHVKPDNFMSFCCFWK